jgi:hypothetical protein
MSGIGGSSNPPGTQWLRQQTDAQQQPTIVADAQKQWPILNRPDIHYRYNLQAKNTPGGLEAWPPGETGTPDRPRPSDFPSDAYGIEIYNPKTTRPLDVLGDVTSHFLVNTDPTIKDYYQRFQQSLSPDQHARLQEQYRHSQRHEGEKRPYDLWLKQSGMPAYFRGYPFKQWPDSFNQKAYTPEQRKMLDEMMTYLKTAK